MRVQVILLTSASTVPSVSDKRKKEFKSQHCIFYGFVFQLTFYFFVERIDRLKKKTKSKRRTTGERKRKSIEISATLRNITMHDCNFQGKIEVLSDL